MTLTARALPWADPLPGLTSEGAAMETTWGAEIGDYCGWLRRDGGRSVGTVRVRRCHLQALARGLGTAKSPYAVTTTELLDRMGGRDWSPETRRLIRSTIRGFYGWAVAHGRAARSPALAIPSQPIPRALPRPIPDAVAVGALEQAGPRGRLLILLAGLCGLRACEIAVVHSADLVGAGESAGLLVHGKGGHERVVPLVHAELVSAIRDARGYLFPGRLDGHLSAHYVSRLLSGLLPGGWTGHTLRHRAGTVAYVATEDLRAVQEFLGHRSVVTTQRYTAISNSALRRAASAAAQGLA